MIQLYPVTHPATVHGAACSAAPACLTLRPCCCCPSLSQCREPAAVERDPALVGELSEAELEAWWGYDLVAPGGLLDRIFRELQVGA